MSLVNFSLDAGELRQRFLDGMGHTACTVNIVTTDGPDGRYGVTVSAMSSVSADGELPTLVICVHHLSPCAQAILDNGHFCVNVLRDNQTHISDSFAGRAVVEGGDKFSCANWQASAAGASPQLADALVAFDCRVATSQRMGTHLVIFGAVANVALGGRGSPLIYASRHYARPAKLEVWAGQ